jgi:hypothetical protein
MLSSERIIRKRKARRKKSVVTIDSQIEPASLGVEFDPGDITKAYSWYSENREVKEGKEWVVAYMHDHPKKFTYDDVASYEKSQEWRTSITLCATARMATYACPLPDSSIAFLDRAIHEIIAKTQIELARPKERVARADPASTLLGDVELIFDTFFNGGYNYFDPEVTKLLQTANAKPAQANAIVKFYEPLRDEVVLGGEGYERLDKKRHRNYLQFVGAVLAQADAYAKAIKLESKLERRPRKRRAKSAEKQVSGVRFAVKNDELNLVSVDPAKIVGARIVWTYDQKYRKLAVLHATDTFTVKGTTIKGLDESSSFAKRLRHPEKVIPGFVDLAKNASQKTFDDIKTKLIPANGRLNENILIIKYYK